MVTRRARAPVLSWKYVAVAAALVLAAVVLAWVSGGLSAAGLALLLGVVGWLAASEMSLRMQMQRLIEQSRELSGDASSVAAGGPSDPCALLQTLPDRIEARLAREDSLLREQAQRRAQAEDELRQIKERYALAVSGANDGMWEWSYKTKKAYFSPRAKNMLGYGEDEIGDDIEEWRARIHPEDLKRALVELQAHLDGRSSHFAFEHRMRHKDGTWRWVLARASAVRHASGKPERLIGLYTDITARKQVQQVLIELSDGLNGLRGVDAYAVLVRQFADIIGASEAFLTECCDSPATRVRMLAHWYQGNPAPCVEFDLAGTPCQEVILSAQPLLVPNGASARWPIERQWGTEAYVGLPCIDTKGTVIGHIACRDSVGIARDLPRAAVLKLFAVRASVEMERQLLERTRRSGLEEEPISRNSTTIH
jgi:PAS domain S-box-containing protein